MEAVPEGSICSRSTKERTHHPPPKKNPETIDNICVLARDCQPLSNFTSTILQVQFYDYNFTVNRQKLCADRKVLAYSKIPTFELGTKFLVMHLHNSTYAAFWAKICLGRLRGKFLYCT
jgi:hypothetical protein